MTTKEGHKSRLRSGIEAAITVVALVALGLLLCLLLFGISTPGIP
jgi:hypothetical protein